MTAKVPILHPLTSRVCLQKYVWCSFGTLQSEATEFQNHTNSQNTCVFINK